jgi:type IV pilus assembly protein PilM
MPSTQAVWGIEVGQCALKAVKLRVAPEDQVELVAFDLIEHPKILSQPDADPDELIKSALAKFAERNEWASDAFVIGVPGQQTFSRFTKLPPVDEKKIPDIVRFEASQQIPFDMDDVVWDYEVFRAEGSPDVEVGIFAMRRDLVRKQIDYLGSTGIRPTMIQTIPSALYNFCRFDGQGATSEGKATVIVDVGAQKTDLVIVEPNSAWSRNIPLGGNNFTEALVKAFKLPFGKAETLKRTAATSKYARQIFQAMRPVFAELVAEIQRSIGFYSSTHRDVELEAVLACGNAFRLPGLQKYLENNLGVGGGVLKLEKLNRLMPSATVNAPQFTENILSFGAAYGLAVQGLGLAKISASLLPPELARIALWKQKQPYFVAAAASLVLAAALPWVRTGLDRSAMASSRDSGEQAKRVISEAEALRAQFQKVQTDNSGKKASIEQLFALHKDNALVPSILAMVHEAVPVVPELQAADSPEEIKKIIAAQAGRLDRLSRKEVVIEGLQIRYSKNIDEEPRGAASASLAFRGGGEEHGGGYMSDSPTRASGVRGGGDYEAPRQTHATGSEGQPGFYVHVTGRMPYGRVYSEAIAFITNEFYENLRRAGRQPGTGFYIPEEDPGNRPHGKNLSTPNLSQYYSEAHRVGSFSTGSRGGVRGGSDVVGDFAPPGAPESKGLTDPVTGEDMSTDWRFDFGFKVRLGEMPAAKPADEKAPG